MELTARARLEADPDTVFAEVADLGTYPSWLGIVAGATPAAPHDDDPGPAWAVVLQARLGPLTRRKRVRMVRTRCDEPRVARFERMEHDGRAHAEWVLSVEVTGGTSTELTMHLSHSGSPTLPLVDLVLREEVRRAGPRLAARLDGRSGA